MNKNYDYKRLTPFKWFVLQNFPFIDEDFDAITNYQLFCKLGEEINKVIESMNQAGEQVEELTNAFNSLQNYVNNYFENLDVQDEINNKLDDMAESGQLTDIIAQYLQLAGLLCYNTKSDMKNAENLVDGSFAKTYGDASYNDGKGQFYKIREIVNTDVVDDVHIIALTNYNDLVAELIPNIKEYPIYSTDYIDASAEDNTTGFQAMLDLASVTFQKIIIKEGVYKIKNHLVVKARNMIEGIGKVVLDFSEFEDDTNYCIEIRGAHDYSKGRNTKVFENITFKGYNSTFGNTAGNEYINKDLFFITGYEFILDNIKAYGFRNVFTYGSNSYIISVINSHLGHNNRVIYFDINAGGYSNSGERLTFSNCILCNNNEVIYNKLGMFSFIDCSIDYNGQISSTYNTMNVGFSSGRSIFNNCHIEDNLSGENATNRFICNQAQLFFIGCEIWIEHHPFINVSGDSSKIIMTNNEIHSTDESSTYFVQSDRNNIIIENYTTLANIVRNSLSKYTNLINPALKGLKTTVNHGTASIIDGYVYQLNSEAYANGESTSDFIPIPKGSKTGFLKFYAQANVAGTIAKNIVSFYDIAGDNIGNAPYNFNIGTEETYKKVDKFDIPANAVSLKINLFSVNLGTANYTKYRDIYLGIN